MNVAFRWPSSFRIIHDIFQSSEYLPLPSSFLLLLPNLLASNSFHTTFPTYEFNPGFNSYSYRLRAFLSRQLQDFHRTQFVILHCGLERKWILDSFDVFKGRSLLKSKIYIFNSSLPFDYPITILFLLKLPKGTLPLLRKGFAQCSQERTDNPRGQTQYHDST